MPKYRVSHIVTFSKVVTAPSKDAAMDLTVADDAPIASEENGWDVDNTDIVVDEE